MRPSIRTISSLGCTLVKELPHAVKASAAAAPKTQRNLPIRRNEKSLENGTTFIAATQWKGANSRYGCRRTPILVIFGLLTTVSAKDGAAYCWGLKGGGRLGDGSNVGSETPVAILGGLKFTSVSVGGNHSCGITESGPTYCWGVNEHGRLGDGTTVDRTAPVEVLTTAAFASIGAGILHTCAVSFSGSVYCWGHDRNGQLGNGTEEETLSAVPVLVGTALVFRSVSAGLAHTCGVTTDDVAYCWGLNSSGQLGIGSTTNTDGPERVSGT